MANKGIDWSSLWKKDEWLAVWIGFLIIIILMVGTNLETFLTGPRTGSLRGSWRNRLLCWRSDRKTGDGERGSGRSRADRGFEGGS